MSALAMASIGVVTPVLVIGAFALIERVVGPQEVEA